MDIALPATMPPSADPLGASGYNFCPVIDLAIMLVSHWPQRDACSTGIGDSALGVVTVDPIKEPSAENWTREAEQPLVDRREQPLQSSRAATAAAYCLESAMLPVPFALAGVFEVLLVLSEGVCPESLPLGGSHLAQLGFLLGSAFVACELALIARRLFPRAARKRNRKRA